MDRNKDKVDTASFNVNARPFVPKAAAARREVLNPCIYISGLHPLVSEEELERAFIEATSLKPYQIKNKKRPQLDSSIVLFVC